MFSRFLAVAFIGAFLAACQTTAPHTLSVATLQGMKIVAVEVEGIDKIRSWPAQEAEFIRTANPPAELVEKLRSEPAASFPEVKAYMTQAFVARLQLETNAQLGSVLAGKKPVKLVLRIEAFDIPSAARRVLIDQTLKMKARIDLVEPASGAVLLSYDGPFYSQDVLGGFVGTSLAAASFERGKDYGTEMINSYIGTYRHWLLGL